MTPAELIECVRAMTDAQRKELFHLISGRPMPPEGSESWNDLQWHQWAMREYGSADVPC
jgi:hypothetical protein